LFESSVLLKFSGLASRTRKWNTAPIPVSSLKLVLIFEFSLLSKLKYSLLLDYSLLDIM
jgi:hypothetical protein